MTTTDTQADMVNLPPHYRGHPSGVECVAIAEDMNFCLGNAFKYLYRCGNKWNDVEDIKKAIWYLEREWDRRLQVHDSTFLRRLRRVFIRLFCGNNDHTANMMSVCIAEDRFPPYMQKALYNIFNAQNNICEVEDILNAIEYAEKILYSQKVQGS
jgi:hypothetical protein